jgi:hypothetical protein
MARFDEHFCCIVYIRIIYQMTYLRLIPAVLLLAFMLNGCSPPLAPPVTTEKLKAPADFPAQYYRDLEASGSKILHVDPTRSLITILVRRGGSLARLGHDHVVASHHVQGYVDLKNGLADLYIPLDSLSVDEADLRLAAALDTQPTAGAIEGTRRNMLDKVLETNLYPDAQIHVAYVGNDRSKLSVTIKLHGKTKTFVLPAALETYAQGIKISGNIEFNQTDFGMTPFSILGGAIQVLDGLALHFEIVANAP